MAAAGFGCPGGLRASPFRRSTSLCGFGGRTSAKKRDGAPQVAVKEALRVAKKSLRLVGPDLGL